MAMLSSSSAAALRRLFFLRAASHHHHLRHLSSLPALSHSDHAGELFSDPNNALTNESVLYVLKKLEKHPRKALDFFNHASAKLGIRPNSTICNLMLRTLAHRDFMAEFWDLAKRLEGEGHSIDGGSYFTILVSLKKQKLAAEAADLAQLFSRGKEKDAADEKVRALVEAINPGSVEDGWDIGIEKKLEEMKPHISDSVVEKVLQEVKARPLKALGFFQWAARGSEYRHGSTVYNAMLRVLGRPGSVMAFWGVVEEMKREGHEVDIDTYVKLMRQFQKCKMLEDSVGLYELMMDGPYKPATHDCGLLLRQISLADAPDLDLVSRVLRKYEANGHSWSKVVYDGILRCLTKSGKFDEAGEVIEKMKLAGFMPDNITYSQMVFGLCRAKRLDEALKVMDDMEAGGCLPDVKTWTVLIQGHCSVGEVDAALACLKKMVEKNYEADGELLDVIVKGLCSANRITDAYVLFVDMMGKGNVKPRQATFKYLIEKLLDQRKLEEALRLLVLMKRHQLPPYADPFSPYISKFGTVEDAKEFLRALNAKDYPSPAAYLYLFKSFFKEGRYTEAQDLLFKCPHHIRKHSDISKLFGSIKPETAT